MHNADTTIAGHPALSESANSSQNIDDSSPASIASTSKASTAVEEATAHQDDVTALKDDATAPKDKGMFGQGQAGMKWSQKEVHEIPKNNMKLVFPGLLLAVFLAAMDQTIVSTALPIIVNNLDQGAGYSWVGRCFLSAPCRANGETRLSVLARSRLLQLPVGSVSRSNRSQTLLLCCYFDLSYWIGPLRRGPDHALALSYQSSPR
jgi:hypothetical protein